MTKEDLRLDLRYYYTTLNESEKGFYEVMAQSFFERKYKIIFGMFPECAPQGGEFDEMPRYFYGYDEFVDFSKVYDAVIWDFPELFYVSNNKMRYDAEGYYMEFGGSPNDYTDQEIDEINAWLDKFYHKFDHITDDFELEVAVHDYILNCFEYEYEDDKLEGRSFEEIYTVVGFMKTNEGVCAAFARLMHYVLSRRGIPVANIIANVFNEDGSLGELHSWLAVKLGGNYYHVDITFNESDSKTPITPQHMYFNLTDEEIKADRDFSHESFPGIVCNCTDYNYYRKMGLYFEDCESLKAKYKEFENDNRGSGKTKYFYIWTSSSLSCEDVTRAVRNATDRTVVKDGTVYEFDNGYYTFETTFN